MQRLDKFVASDLRSICFRSLISVISRSINLTMVLSFSKLDLLFMKRWGLNLLGLNPCGYQKRGMKVVDDS